jgi:transposase
LPKRQDKRAALILEIGMDGYRLIDALDQPTAPEAGRELAMVQTLRQVWRLHYARDDGRVRWRNMSELPPVGERMQSP